MRAEDIWQRLEAILHGTENNEEKKDENEEQKDEEEEQEGGEPENQGIYTSTHHFYLQYFQCFILCNNYLNDKSNRKYYSHDLKLNIFVFMSLN